MSLLRKSASLFLFLVAAWNGFSQQEISVEDFTIRNTFHVKSVSGINWTDDGHFYTTLEDDQIVRYDISSGRAVETVLAKGVLPAEMRIEEYSFSPDQNRILLATDVVDIYRRSFVAEYYLYDVRSKRVEKLSDGGKQSYATFSPDGSKVAFVRQNNLYYVTLDGMTEVAVTTDGKFNHIINGTTDWVYEEELSFVVGFFWAPDSKKLAYYRFDESNVKEYLLQVWGNNLYPMDYRFKYPKAGEENSRVSIHIYNLESRNTVKAQLPEHEYIPRVQWTQDPELLAVRLLNRLQNELTLFHVAASSGESTEILKEKSDTYIDLRFVEDLIYLKDKKHFICASERSGFKHLYLYATSGKLVNAITSGEFEVSNLVAIDEKSKHVYYVSTEASPLERQFYRINFAGTRKERLTPGKGQHHIKMSPDFRYYMDYHKSSNSPLVVSLFQTRGNKLMRVLESNDELRTKLKEYNVAPKEFFTFKADDGTELNGYFLKPPSFSEARKYPVVLYQYSGPGSQNTGDTWAGSHYFFHQLLAQKGFLVAVVDTRGTGARGAAFKKMTYKELGKYELQDLVAAAKYFSTLPYVDKERLGIWGWSYGGYMAALAMTKASGVFKTGIAVAPVTNWRFYDTIYTERFLQTPQLNPSGYDDNSPLTHAARLQGNFLMIHGTGDDNVHFQNSVQFESALIHAGKQFRSFYYPDKHHGIQGSKTRLHLYTMMLNFLLEAL
ncbi:MAG TPA: S9 family peptidase [Ohtaekwangia sp.]|nr:S9 family peptidase [Ohtaekwangia sp.]